MPRLIFDNILEFKNWVGLYCKGGKYLAYKLLDDNSITCIPRVSTSPIMIAYFELQTIEDFKDVEKMLLEKFIPLFKIKTIEWNIDRGIGIKMPDLY